MVYLMMHSIHFYLQLYGVRHMVKDHSDYMDYFFKLAARVLDHPTEGIAHTMALVTSVMHRLYPERDLDLW